MKTTAWLIISSRGNCRLTKRQASPRANEVAIHLALDLPDMLFKKPNLVASIIVPGEGVALETIGSVTTDNVRDAIEEATGLTFDITVVAPEETGSTSHD